jgi:uncharacterized membrane protein
MDNTQENGMGASASSSGEAQAQVETAPLSTTQAQAAEPAPATQSVGDHKLYAILGYILPFLFFLPLLQDNLKHNEFARFHANQQLLLLIGWVGVYIVGNMLIMVLYMLVFLLPLLNLAFLVLAIIGVINAVQGEMKELPLIGKFKLLK